jgi:pimeloyl-ACP methyl ester carboxylesterase
LPFLRAGVRLGAHATNGGRRLTAAERVIVTQRELLVAGVLPGVLTLPSSQPRAGVIALHPSNQGSRDFPLARHLAGALGALGIAVLRFDRRAPRLAGDDVPLRVQAADACAAIAALRTEVTPALPVVVWGFSQGAWVALIVAHELALAGVIVVGASGVSPSEQMRYATARRLREAGFDETAVAEMLETRRIWESVPAGGSTEEAERALAAAARKPWFEHAWLPTAIEPFTDDDGLEGDFDPAPLVRTLACPLLAVVGDDDRWVPLPESIAVLARAPDFEALHVPGGDHAPTTDGDGLGPVLDGYERGLIDWLGRRVLTQGA